MTRSTTTPLPSLRAVPVLLGAVATFLGALLLGTSAVASAATTDPVAVTVTAPSPTVPFGGQAAPLIPTYATTSGATPVTPATPATCSASFYSTSTPITTYPNPGTYTVTCSGAVDARYTFTYVNGTITITPPPPCRPFTDVGPDNRFCPDIQWLADHHITTGYPDGGYHPIALVTREQMAVLLYRFANPGAAAAPCASKPFPDVSATSPFCPEITWLAAQHISQGYAADNTFRPALPVGRQEMAAFLYRLARPGIRPPECTLSPFTDVFPTSPFCGVIKWVAESGVADGYPDGSFHPTWAVGRQEMAAFVHRLSSQVHPS